jgi:3-deoxy-D-manno-octulosonic-acid transferase
MDSPDNARRFFDAVHPILILFIKYEYWYYYLREARQRKIPLLLISGIFRNDQPFFKWYGSLHRQMLLSFTHFFVQNKASADLLQKLGIEKQVTVSGDTRFDRVIKIAEQFKPVDHMAEFCGDSLVVVAGSTWTEDDKELAHFTNTNLHIKFIIAPHNVIDDRLAECRHLYKHAVKYSQLAPGNFPAGVNTLVIDNVGMLSRLYYYADVCYVGGAFNSDGVHNVLEPAVYGKPVVFGPVYEKYFEAVELIEAGGAVSVDNALELEAELKKLLTKDEEYEKAAGSSRKYVYSKTGSTQQIMEFIYKNRLLIS